MNVVDHVNSRIDARASEVKNLDMKGYKSEARATAVAEKYSKLVGDHFGTGPSRYVIVFNEKTGKYFPAFDMTELLPRTTIGGYVGILAAKGFICY